MSEKLDIHVHVCMVLPGDENTVEQSLVLHQNDDYSWLQVVDQLKKELNICNEQRQTWAFQTWAFQYFDNEDDIVFGKTEVEWQEAIRFGSKTQGNVKALEVNAFLMVSSNPEDQECNRNAASKTACCGKSCSGFTQQMPPLPPDDGITPINVVNTNLHEYKYINEALRAVTLPLGALGGGSIALAGDGGLRQWQVSGAVNHTAHVPNSFFAIRVSKDSTTKCVVLQSKTWYDQTGFKSAAFISDHVVPQASKDLLNTVEGIKTLEVTAQYPIAEVDYLSDEVPVKVHLEAFSPCIPLDSKNSAIPIIVFNYTVTNDTSTEATVSLLGSLQNFAGWDGLSIIKDSSNPGYGSNLNYHVEKSNLYDGVGMCKSSVKDERKNSNGRVAIAVVPKTNDLQVNHVLEYESVKDLWSNFEKLEFDDTVGPHLSPNAETLNGAICCTRKVAANSSETFTFFLAWYFPHRYVNWSQPNDPSINDSNSDYYIGNKYTSFWKNIEEVLTYTSTNLEDLSTKTRKFRDSMFEGTLPWQLIDSAAGRVSVLKSPSCMWQADGRFYGFEGCNPAGGRNPTGGCCPLNCTHVWNYEMALAKCFPDLERTMRDTDLGVQITPDAVIPSRTTVPLTLRPVWTFWNNYTQNPKSTQICVDGEIGTVLKTYREFRHGASQEWFDGKWPAVKRIMSRWMTELDDGTGVIPGPQPNTYDCALYGVNVYIGGYYLAALRAAEEMAKLQKDTYYAGRLYGTKQYHEVYTDLAATYQARFQKGSAKLDSICFNGKWYVQKVDPANPVNVVADASWVDCLVGQWWAHALGLGYILSQSNIRTTLSNVFEANHVDHFVPASQSPRPFFDERDAGLHICVFPGAVPANPLVYYSEGAWSGLEYEFAGLCLYEGLTDIALHVLTDTRNKYDGTRRSPWNEIECGDHYVRPMAAFLLFEAASGQDWSFTADGLVRLSFAPRLCQTDFRGFFILGTCWGQYVQKGDSQLTQGTVELSVQYGELKLAELQLASRATKAVVRLSGIAADPLPVQVAQDNGSLAIKFIKGTAPITTGTTLHITLSG